MEKLGARTRVEAVVRALETDEVQRPAGTPGLE
jgi:DNA-binding NarL/FixJ family response regulator